MQRRALVVELAVNFLLPWLAYRWAQPQWGEVGGLVASSVPPLLWSAWELTRHKRVDALSLFVLAGIVFSTIAMLLGGDARVLLLRESLVSGLFGLAFLLSAPTPRPLLYYLARATVQRESAEHGRSRFEQLWQDNPLFRQKIAVMNAVWGAGLVAETALRAVMAWSWPPERFLLVSPWIGYGIYGALTAWTLWYRKRIRLALQPA
jgi:hypothetical protein